MCSMKTTFFNNSGVLYSAPEVLLHPHEEEILLKVLDEFLEKEEEFPPIWYTDRKFRGYIQCGGNSGVLYSVPEFLLHLHLPPLLRLHLRLIRNANRSHLQCVCELVAIDMARSLHMQGSCHAALRQV